MRKGDIVTNKNSKYMYEIIDIHTGPPRPQTLYTLRNIITQEIVHCHDSNFRLNYF